MTELLSFIKETGKDGCYECDWVEQGYSLKASAKDPRENGWSSQGDRANRAQAA